MKILNQNEDQEQSEAAGEFCNYSEIFANIAKFSLCVEISLHSEISLYSENYVRMSPGKGKILHSETNFLLLLLFYVFFKILLLLLLLNYVY